MGPRAARAPKLSRSSAPRGSALPSPPFHGVWLWGRHEPPALSLLCSRAASSALCCPRRGWQRFSRPRRCRGSHKPRQRDSHSPPMPAPSPSITQTTQPRVQHGSSTGPPRASSPIPAPHLPAANLPATPPHHQQGKGTGKHWELTGSWSRSSLDYPSERRRVAARSRAARSSSFCSGQAEMMQNSRYFLRKRSTKSRLRHPPRQQASSVPGERQRAPQGQGGATSFPPFLTSQRAPFGETSTNLLPHGSRGGEITALVVRDS